MTEKMMTIIMAILLAAVVLFAVVKFFKSRKFSEDEEINYQQPKQQQVVPLERDSDHDGVPDSIDSEPFNPRKF